MESIQRVRYPPFDHSNIDPQKIPITEVIIRSNSKAPPPFKIGSDEGWLVEWKTKEGDYTNFPVIDSVTTVATPPFLMRTRNGWYIDPDPLHSMARKTITPTVGILIISLFVHAIAPAIDSMPILSIFTERSLQVGPLDYPLLLFFTFPIFLIPIILRMIANMRDIRRQNDFIANPLNDPSVEYSIKDQAVEIYSIVMPDGVKANHVTLQVGVAIPERSVLLETAKRSDNSQPPPGMSTPLSVRRITTAEEHGTGVGESTPLPVEYSRVLLLEPLRVREKGITSKITNEYPIEVTGPEKRWPGTVYSSLIALHWELIINAESKNTRFTWVKPIIMPSNGDAIEIESLPLGSARVEDND